MEHQFSKITLYLRCLCKIRVKVWSILHSKIKLTSQLTRSSLINRRILMWTPWILISKVTNYFSLKISNNLLNNSLVTLVSLLVFHLHRWQNKQLTVNIVTKRWFWFRKPKKEDNRCSKISMQGRLRNKNLKMKEGLQELKPYKNGKKLATIKSTSAVKTMIR